MSEKNVEVEIEFQLSEDQRTEKARESCRINKELDALEDAFKVSRADWRQRIKDLKDARDRCQDAFMVGSEMRKLTK